MRRLSKFLTPMLLGLALLLASPSTQADEILFDGLWIPQVTVVGINDGQVVYETATGAEVTRPLREVEGLRLTGYPRLEEGRAAAEAGELEQAHQPDEFVTQDQLAEGEAFQRRLIDYLST